MTDSIVYALCNERKNIDAKTLFLIYGKKKPYTHWFELQDKKKRFQLWNRRNADNYISHLSELKFTKM